MFLQGLAAELVVEQALGGEIFLQGFWVSFPKLEAWSKQ